MTKQLAVLQCGSCEPLKVAVHGTALGLFAIMGLYNMAAWLSRRQRHLAFNAAVYTILTIWEERHVRNHLAEIAPRPPTAVPVSSPTVQDAAPRAAPDSLAA